MTLEIQLDAICRNEIMLGQAFLAAAMPDENGDEPTAESFQVLLDACKERGVAPAPAIQAALAREQKIYDMINSPERVRVIHKPKSFRIPIQIR